MTRKHFEAIASELAGYVRGEATEEQRYTARCIAYSLADVLAGTNAAFDRQRFLAACGVDTPRRDA